jgi:penicillin-insensitive murein endopeptidase
MSARPRLLVFLALAGWLPLAAAGPWAEVREPLAAPPEVIGSYAAGCVTGAAVLAPRGPGYQIMRPSRHRRFGHPGLVRYVERLGRQVAERGWGRMLVGDLAQPRGGPMASGHRSHQSGLDADIWLDLLPPGTVLSAAESETRPMRTVVDAARGELDAGRWRPRYGELLRLAAETPGVERIFVHPVIKQALCRQPGPRDWLARLRPYWGHDAHFHVRLACPPDSPRCRAQDPVPPGDGCDQDLERWVADLRAAALAPGPSRPPAPAAEPPAECAAVLAGQAPGERQASRR